MFNHVQKKKKKKNSNPNHLINLLTCLTPVHDLSNAAKCDARTTAGNTTLRIRRRRKILAGYLYKLKQEEIKNIVGLY